MYKDNTGSVEKKLLKDSEITSLSKDNKLMYTYLNYCVSLKNQDTTAIDKWKKQLVSVDNSGAYLKKSKQFLD